MFLRDRTLECSDKYRVHLCEMCGLIAIANLRKQVFLCKRCNNKTRIAQVEVPYAFKLLVQVSATKQKPLFRRLLNRLPPSKKYFEIKQELMAMGLAPRLMTVGKPPAKTKPTVQSDAEREKEEKDKAAAEAAPMVQPVH